MWGCFLSGLFPLARLAPRSLHLVCGPSHPTLRSSPPYTCLSSRTLSFLQGVGLPSGSHQPLQLEQPPPLLSVSSCSWFRSWVWGNLPPLLRCFPWQPPGQYPSHCFLKLPAHTLYLLPHWYPLFLFKMWIYCCKNVIPHATNNNIYNKTATSFFSVYLVRCPRP